MRKYPNLVGKRYGQLVVEQLLPSLLTDKEDGSANATAITHILLPPET